MEKLSELTNLLGGGEQLQIGSIFISLIVSMLLGYFLSQVFKVYYRDSIPADFGIGNSFLLMMPAVTSIFIIIQYSLPLSLGLLGALSFVRFRTPVKRAEDIAFILVAIAVSLCCAVQYYMVAFFLLTIVLLYSMYRKKLPFLDLFSKESMLVTLHDEDEINVSDVMTALTSNFAKPIIISSQNADNYHTLVFSIENQDDTKHTSLIAALKDCLKKTTRIDIFYPGNELSE